MEPPAATATGIYCKTCGYDLRASGEAGRCPECGRPFVPADPKTFRPRPFAAPWKRALGRWAKRAAILLLALAVLLGGPWAWYYRGWKQEQAALAETRGRLDVNYQPILGGRPGRWLYRHRVPGSFVLEGKDDIDLRESATDADLRALRKLRHLEILTVRGAITPAGLAGLREFPGLRWLRVEGTRITDADLAVLRTLPRLERLSLDAAPITDAGLVCLDQLSDLRELSLRYTPITDAGLARLDQLPALRELNLSYTPVTDAGLVHLEKLPELRQVHLTGTEATPAGAARLKAALPGCAIYGP